MRIDLTLPTESSILFNSSNKAIGFNVVFILSTALRKGDCFASYIGGVSYSDDEEIIDVVEVREDINFDAASIEGKRGSTFEPTAMYTSAEGDDDDEDEEEK